MSTTGRDYIHIKHLQSNYTFNGTKIIPSWIPTGLYSMGNPFTINQVI